MELGRAHAASVRGANGHLSGEPTRGPVAYSRQLIDHLVETVVVEAEELDLRDRHPSGDGETDRRAGDDALREWRVDDTRPSIFLEEPVRCAEHSAGHTDVLAEHQDALVAGHLQRQRLIDRLD